MNVQGAYIETEALLGFDKDDYEAGGTGWSGHGTGCSGCTICMMNKVEGKPAMIPSDVSGQGEKRVKLPDPGTVEQAREILKKVREAKRPVINAGNGIRIGKAFDVFARVVKKLGIPVLTCGAAKTEAGYRFAIGARPGKAVLFDVDLDGRNVENLAEYAAKCVKDQISTGSNTRGSAEYRKHLTGVLIRRAVCKLEQV